MKIIEMKGSKIPACSMERERWCAPRATYLTRCARPGEMGADQSKATRAVG